MPHATQEVELTDSGVAGSLPSAGCTLQPEEKIIWLTWMDCETTPPPSGFLSATPLRPQILQLTDESGQSVSSPSRFSEREMKSGQEDSRMRLVELWEEEEAHSTLSWVSNYSSSFLSSHDYFCTSRSWRVQLKIKQISFHSYWSGIFCRHRQAIGLLLIIN